jgi:hypothetical protein
MDVCPGAELCINPIYALALFQQWGWAAVKYFVCPKGDLEKIKTTIGALPYVEGAVVYHMNQDLATVEVANNTNPNTNPITNPNTNPNTNTNTNTNTNPNTNTNTITNMTSSTHGNSIVMAMFACAIVRRCLCFVRM